MSRALPQNASDILAGCHHADLIGKDLHAAYWLHGRADDAALYLFDKAHKEFAKMAREMGYSITPLVAESADEVAE
jgi:hypothetical protein